MSSNTGTFVHEFMRKPTTVASLIPSGKSLAGRVSIPVPHDGDPVVVELGAGTGAFSRNIQTILAGRGHHIAIDVNERFIDLLARQFDDIDAVAADARQLPIVLRDRGHPHADVIVSGLPWAAFPPHHQQEILDAIASALSPDGAFTTFAYTHALLWGSARQFRHALHERFEEVVPGRTVWANLPPAMVYHCRRPRIPTSTPPGKPFLPNG
jgi:phosphatidylethanolamine/phosphatidyl-N-methylethanolamine N-methyltransferase